jgi:hypothetical protein
MELRVLHIPAALIVAGVALSVSGAACIQPEDTFDDFAERQAKIEGNTDPSATASVSTGLIVGCQPPGPDSLVAGTYVFALSAQLSKTKPIFLRADVTFGDPLTAPSVSMTLQPLGTPYIDTGSAPFSDVGAALPIGPFPLNPDGTFEAQLPSLAVDGGANSITGNDLEATIKLISGQFCDINPGDVPPVICGPVSGDVTEPIDLELDPEQNNYGMTKYEGAVPTDPTQFVYDCGGSKAVAP